MTPIFDLSEKSGWLVVSFRRMEKFEGRADLEKNREFCLGLVKFEMPIRHPSGNVERIIIYNFGGEVTDGNLSHRGVLKELDENTSGKTIGSKNADGNLSSDSRVTWRSYLTLVFILLVFQSL